MLQNTALCYVIGGQGPTRYEEQQAAEDCENNFISSCRRDVELNFKQCRPALGNSSQVARLEDKLYENPDLHRKYNKVIQDYMDCKHMVSTVNEVFYSPHQAVVKRSSPEKIRVVLDGAAKTSNGIALNDIFDAGPVLQQDLWGILLRFRMHQFVFTSDISAMYRQIWLDKSLGLSNSFVALFEKAKNKNLSFNYCHI